LRESCEIDWYLQAQLAYNKRFGSKHSVEKKTECKLDIKTAQREHAKKILFLLYRGYSSDEISAILE